MHRLVRLPPERFLVWDLLRDTEGYYLNHHVVAVDFTAVERSRVARLARGAAKPSYVAYALHAMGRVLPRHPRFNSYLRAFPTPRLALYDGVDIAHTVEKRAADGRPRVALNLLRGADALSLDEVAARLAALRAAPFEDLPYAGNYRRFLAIPPFLRYALFRLLVKPFPGRMRDIAGTCGFTSVGAAGTDWTCPLSPKSLTVSLGRVATRALAVDGRLEPRLSAFLTLTYDHRIADGNDCAAVGRDLKAHLEGIAEDA